MLTTKKISRNKDLHLITLASLLLYCVKTRSPKVTKDNGQDANCVAVACRATLREWRVIFRRSFLILLRVIIHTLGNGLKHLIWPYLQFSNNYYSNASLTQQESVPGKKKKTKKKRKASKAWIAMQAYALWFRPLKPSPNSSRLASNEQDAR
jgi:hypothetical protein